MLSNRFERRIVESGFATREEAEARREELAKDDPSLESALAVERYADPKPVDE
jgi:hypothetical protein